MHAGSVAVGCHLAQVSFVIYSQKYYGTTDKPVQSGTKDISYLPIQQRDCVTGKMFSVS